jgi:hypothetical protein
VVKINTLNRGNTFQDFPSTCGILWFKIKANGEQHVEINGCDWKALKKMFKLCIFVFLIQRFNKSFQRKLIVNYDKNLKPNLKIKCNRVKVLLGGTIRNHLKEWKRTKIAKSFSWALYFKCFHNYIYIFSPLYQLHALIYSLKFIRN